MIPSYIVKIHREEKTERGISTIKIDFINNSIYDAFPYPATAAQISPYYRGWMFNFAQNIYFQHTKPYEN